MSRLVAHLTALALSLGAAMYAAALTADATHLWGAPALAAAMALPMATAPALPGLLMRRPTTTPAPAGRHVNERTAHHSTRSGRVTCA